MPAASRSLYWATQALVAYVSAGRSAIVLDVSPDVRVLAFTAVVSTLAGLLFGSAPAIRASRLEMALGKPAGPAGTRHALGGRGLAICSSSAQVALSLVLLVGAGLFVRSLQNLNVWRRAATESRILVVRVEPRGSDQRSIPGTTDGSIGIYRELIGTSNACPASSRRASRAPRPWRRSHIPPG